MINAWWRTRQQYVFPGGANSNTSEHLLTYRLHQNQMQEALLLFESIMSLTWFKSSSIILFLNKIDLFKEKLTDKPIKDYFPDYSGAVDDYNAASQHFADKFRALNKTEDREVYVHFTNATDTNLLKITMQSVQDTIIQKNLSILIL